jgi:dodecin
LSHAAVAWTDARHVRRDSAAITVLREGVVEESVYRVIEVIGTSPKSWEEAARMAVETAGVTLEDLRVAEITELDMRLQDNKVMAYRAKVKISFKYRI